MEGSLISGLEPNKWTIGAIQCYKRNCNCKGCFIQQTYVETLYYRCAMKYCVRQLIKKYGAPDDITLNNITEEE